MAKYTTYTKERLADALLELISEKAMDEIPISELAERAQVNRASFYRNFSSKEDVLAHRFTSRLRAWTSSHEVMLSTDGDPYLQARDFFEFMLSERELMQTLLRAGALDHVLLHYLRITIGPAETDHPDDAFYRSYHLYGIFGVYREWVRQGMVESPEHMAAMVVYQMHQPHDSLIRKEEAEAQHSAT